MITVKHSHGLTEKFATLATALTALSSVYGADVVTDGSLSEGRVLVWADDASASNDDGARAVAVISGTE